MRDPSEILSLLEEKLEAMLFDGEDITARGVVRRMGDVLKHPSDVTRIEGRRALLAKFQARQADLRSVIEKADKTSKTRLAAALAERDTRIAELERDRDLLIASHRALILAVGEMGGMRAWLKLFEGYEGAVRRLDALGATPSATVHPISQVGGK